MALQAAPEDLQTRRSARGASFRGWPAAVCLGLAACAGGQSGTETPICEDPFATVAAAAPACACALADEGALLRATLLTLEPDRVSARVDELVATLGSDADSPSAGDEVEAARVESAPCGAGLDLEVGDDVLVVFARGEAGADDRALVARWDDEIVFGRDGAQVVALPSEDAARLLDLAQCEQAFSEVDDADAGSLFTQTQAIEEPTCE